MPTCWESVVLWTRALSLKQEWLQKFWVNYHGQSFTFLTGL